ncbi:MAG: DUF3604 domain-containing protein [Thiogranum sp.]
MSNGRMFTVETFDGQPLTRELAAMPAHYEPLIEVTQIKGDGEAHPLLSPDDEFADYETWDLGNLDMSQAKTDDMLAGEYARSGLKRGLEFEQKFGVNPYKFGQIGSTDSHTSLPAVEENNFFGKHSGVEPSPERAMHVTLGGEQGKIMGYEAGLYVESSELARQVIDYMDEGVQPDSSNRVLLDESGDLYWVTEVDGNEVRYYKEPKTTFGQRFMSGFIMILPVEHQL